MVLDLRLKGLFVVTTNNFFFARPILIPVNRQANIEQTGTIGKIAT